MLPSPEPRLVKQAIEIGGITYQPGVVLFASAYLLHHDASVYPDPYAFRPERFLEQAPGTYTWIPFGGGRRRCLGASFATLEMKLVLRAVLARCALRTPAGLPETTIRRGITFSPSGECRVILEQRSTEHAGSRESRPAVPALA